MAFMLLDGRFIGTNKISVMCALRSRRCACGVLVNNVKENCARHGCHSCSQRVGFSECAFCSGSPHDTVCTM